MFRRKKKMKKKIEDLKQHFQSFSSGTHFCSIYQNEQEQFATIIPFTLVGLEKNHKCVYIVDENTRKRILKAFQEYGVDLKPYMKSGQLEFLTKDESYLKDGYFDPEQMINLLKRLENEAIDEGYQGLWGTGEMTWYFTKMPGVEQLIEYEAKLNYFLSESNTTLLCQYNETKFSPEVLMDVVYTHPNVILYSVLHENPYYIPPDHFLAKRRGEVPPELYHSIIHDIQKRTKLKRKHKQVQKEYQTLFHNIKDAVFVHDLEGEFLTVNDTAVDRLGYSREELLSMRPEDLDAPEYVENVEGNLQKIRENQKFTFETVHVTKNGERIPVEINSTIINVRGEKAVLSVARDITQRKKAEERSHKLYSLLKSIKKITQLIPRASNIQNLLQKSAEILLDMRGYLDIEISLLDRETDIIRPRTHKGNHERKSWRTTPEGNGTAPRCVKEVIEGKSRQILDKNEEYCKGCTYCVFPSNHTTVLLPLMKNNSITGVISVCFEAERKIDEEELTLLAQVTNDLAFAQSKLKTEAELEETYEIINMSPAVAFLWKKEEGWPVEFVSENVQNLCGYTAEELTSDKLSYADIIHPADLERVKHEVSRFSQEAGREQFSHTPYRIVTKEGKVKWVEDKTFIRRNDQGEATFFQGIVLDITERRKAQQKIETLHKWARKLNRADSMDEIFEYTLDAVEATLGYEHTSIGLKKNKRVVIQEYRGTKIPEHLRTLSLDESSVVTKVVDTGKPMLVNDVDQCPIYIAPNPQVKAELAIPIKISGNTLGVLNVESVQKHAFNESDKRLLEILASHVAVAIRELQREENLEFLLTLLRHDIRNKVAVIKGYLALLEDTHLTKEQQEFLTNSLDATKEISGMLKKIGKLKEIDKEEELTMIPLQNVLSRAVQKNEAKAEEYDITLEYTKTPHTVLGGPLLEELFSNLIENALEHSNASIVKVYSTESEDHITVTVEDDGSGIPDQIRDRLFQQGVKGKNSSGLGIGMYIVKEIAEKYQSSIQVQDSELGGARFNITLKRHTS